MEIYNPWVNHSAASAAGTPACGELIHAAATQAVDQDRNGPDGTPVWRLAITPAPPGSRAVAVESGRPEPADPDDPDPNRRPVLERVVYFTPNPGPIDAQVAFFGSGSVGQAPGCAPAVTR